MHDDQSVIGDIAAALQRVYGDATQTHLDLAAAQAAYDVCVKHGMAPLSVVAAIVAAAGGRVTVPADFLVNPPAEVMRIDELGGGVTLKTQP